MTEIVESPQPRMPTVTESQFAPSVATAQEGDIWIRLHGVGIRQRYEFMLDKTSAALPAANGWVGYMPQAGGVGLHMSKFGPATPIGQYQSQWVEAQQGLAIQINVQNPVTPWTISHNLAYRLVDITCIKAEDDWTFNPSTNLWTDPQAATRAPTILMPRMVKASNNVTFLHFVEAVRGVALVRR
jgi:hypothetical protein